MALTIVVRSGDSASPPSITFDAPRIVIGRGEGCEVRLPDPSVSHRHASIRQRGTEYIVVDEGSTNGTFVGPVRLSPQSSRVLRSGQLIRVGRIWLEIAIEQAPATQRQKLATKEMALSLVASALRAQGQQAELVARVVEGPDQGLELELADFDRRYVIGRGVGTDLQVTDADASRRHVELVRHAETVRVKDLGSKNGTLLDSEPLLRGKVGLWKSDQILKVGANLLSYQDPIASALDELEAAEDEPLDALELIPPPSEAGSGEPSSSEGIAESPLAAAPLVERPRRSRGSSPLRRIASTDLFVATFALGVLALSALGLFWLFSSP